MVLNSNAPLDRRLLQVVDAGLAGVIFLVPFCMGGRHAMGQLALTILVVATVWAWAARQSLRAEAAWRHTWAVMLLTAGVALLLLQVVPLTPSLLSRLAPHTAGLFTPTSAGYAKSATLGGWSTLSLAPAETLGGLVLYLDYSLLFLVAVQRIRAIEDVERLLRWCAASAVCVAIFGIIQYLVGNGKFFWFYEHPYASAGEVAKGSFSNRNHFAHFLALGIGPLIWQLQDVLRRRRGHFQHGGKISGGRFSDDLPQYLVAMALAIVLFAGLLSLSRGGIAAMAIAALLSSVVCFQVVSGRAHFMAIFVAAGLLIGGSLAIFGFDRVVGRLDDLSSGSLEELDQGSGRRTIWAAACKAFPDFLYFGSGVGSFRDVYPMYADTLPDEGLEFTHAESGYLQVAEETGLAGIALMLGGVLFGAFWCYRGLFATDSTRVRAGAAAVAAGLVASVCHSLVDFVWYVPACTAIVAILAACALRLSQLPAESRKRVGERSAWAPRVSMAPRFVWLSGLAVLTVLGVWMISNRLGPAMAQPSWDRYLLARETARKQSPETLLGASADVATQRRWVVWLEEAVSWQPDHARAHLALAETHRRLFDALQINSVNPMSLTNVRDAAVQSRFASREALVEWLSRAVGDHWRYLEHALRHTRAALRFCPLQGRAYVYLADLSFLDGVHPDVQRGYIAQAIRLRPYDGAVLYAAATDALLAGDAAQWLVYLKRAFCTGPRQQNELIENLVASTPAEGLPALADFIVREFDPGRECTLLLHKSCAKRCRDGSFAFLIQRRAEQAEAEAERVSGVKSTPLWLEAGELYKRLGNHSKAIECARNALRSDPNSAPAHQQLGLFLLEQGSFVEAESLFRWRLQRAPNDQVAQDGFRRALKGRLDGQRRAAVPHETLR